MIRVICLIVCSIAHIGVYAGDLQSVFEAALLNDSQYRSARAELSSIRQLAPMARAALRPNVSITWSDANVKGSVTTELGNQVSGRDLDYRSPVRNLSLRMPLFNRDASQRIQIADYQVAYGEFLFAMRTSDLLDRVAGAYFQFHVARQSATSASAQLDAAIAQRNQSKRSFELGEGTRTNAQEAEASFVLATALLAESQNQLVQATLALQHITGLDTSELNAFADPAAYAALLDPKVPLRKSLQEWLATGDSKSPSILAKRTAVEIAKAAIDRNSAGHYPRLDFVASATTSRNESINTLNQSIEQQSLGLQLNLPIYSGGYVNASVNQAVADLEKAQADLENELQTVTRSITKLFFAEADSRAKALAYQQILASQNATLEGLKKGQLADLVAQTDVVIGAGKVAQAKTDASKSFSEFMLARIQLITKSGGDPQEALKMIEKIDKTIP